MRDFFIGVWPISLLVENLLIVILLLEGAYDDTFNFYFASFSAVVNYVPLEAQAQMLDWELPWWPLSLPLPHTYYIHNLRVMHSTCVSLRCHTRSKLIVYIHCIGFNYAYLAVRLLGAYLAFPVLRGGLLAGASLTRLFSPCFTIYFS